MWRLTHRFTYKQNERNASTDHWRGIALWQLSAEHATQNIPHFFLHRMTVLSSADKTALFDYFVKIANQDADHLGEMRN
jgi:hypothetical protein